MEHELPGHDSGTIGESQPVMGFLERVKKATETTGSSLYDICNEKGVDSPELEEALDDVVFGIALSDEEYAANAKKLQSGRVRPDEATEIAKQQREKFELIRKVVISEAGLPTEELVSDIEKGRAAIMERLAGVDFDNVTSDDLLRKVGILHEDENGDATFAYPRDLMPDSINQNWDTYIAAVEKHIKMGREVGGGFRPKTDLGEADRSRRFAHNAIAHDLDKVLGFEGLPDENWDFEKTRRLVAKMRETKFVGRETSESLITSQAMARGLGSLGLKVVDVLSARKES